MLVPAEQCVTLPAAVQHMLQDSLPVIGVKPSDAPVALIPSHLLLGIHARVLLHPFHRHRQLPFAVEHAEHLLVADGVERIEVAQWIEPAGFFEKSLLHHPIHTGIDAGKEFLTLAPKPHLDDVEGALAGDSHAETAVGQPAVWQISSAWMTLLWFL